MDPGFGMVLVIAAGLAASLLSLWLRSKPRKPKR